jgi:hypothetical protein
MCFLCLDLGPEWYQNGAQNFAERVPKHIHFSICLVPEQQSVYGDSHPLLCAKEVGDWITNVFLFLLAHQAKQLLFYKPFEELIFASISGRLQDSCQGAQDPESQAGRG